MIAVNVGAHCLIYSPTRIDIQPALSGVEISILISLAQSHPALSISALACEIGQSYSNVYAMCHRLAFRGLVAMKRNGCGLEVSALASVLEGG